LVNGSGQVYYARTFGFGAGVGNGAGTTATDFSVTGIPNGTYSLYVVANGIASNPVSFTVGSTSGETVWVEDSVPGGGTQASDGGDAWTWVSSNPTPFSGSLASQSNIASGEHQHYFYGASNTLTVGVGDKLFAYVYLD